MRLIRYQQPRLTGLSPFSALRFSSLENEMNALMNSVFSDPFRPQSWGTSNFSHPNADVYEDKDNYYVRAEVPGMKREDIRLEMGDGVLTIGGARKTFAADGKEERSESFERTLSVPAPVKEDSISATYSEGILTVTLPKREEVKPRKIAIEIK